MIFNNQVISIEECIEENLRLYFTELEGQVPTNIYELVIAQAERAAILFVLNKCAYNQTQAAKMLGISRNLLRARMTKYHIKDK